MNYSAVAPPTQGGGIDPQSAFADALARARQIAAKINQPSDSDTPALKRSFEGSSDAQPEAKKIATNPAGDNSFGVSPGIDQGNMNYEQSIAERQSAINFTQQFMQGQPSSQPQPNASAMAAASAVASQINQKLGAIASSSGNSAPPMGQNNVGGGGGPIGGMGLGMVSTEDFKVPDRMVGLIIGKGGEQISTIQMETGCKVQFSPEPDFMNYSGGLPERPVTLTGSPDSIGRAKEMIQKIIAKGQGGDPNSMGDGMGCVEIMIPGSKVGLVIGKSGETIKSLQERAGVKMVMIQDSNQPTMQEKPLRITGDPMKCQRAKDMVVDLIAEKDLEGSDMMGGPYGGGGGNDYGGGGRTTQEIGVPRGAVGVIIGKGGDMIKKIQQDSGARVQFTPDDGNTEERCCSITGSVDKVQQAKGLILDLIASAASRAGPGGMGRGRGRGRGGGPGGFDDRRGPGGPGGGFGGDFRDEHSLHVPGDKCGLVIGKGGETIKEINRLSGAYVELSRQPPPNPREKIFTIRGDPGQIQTAVEMICEKAGIPVPPQGGPPGGPGGPGGPPGGGGPGFNQGGFNGPPGGGQYGGNYNQQPNQPPQQPPAYAPQGWGNAYQQWQGSGNDPNKPQDPNAAAWAAYYAQYYNQAGGGQAGAQQQGGYQQQNYNQMAAGGGYQQPGGQQPQQQPPQQPAQPANTGASPAINPQTGQPDYSQQWAEYYQSQGMHYHAQAILQQAAQRSGTGAPQGGGPPHQ